MRGRIDLSNKDLVKSRCKLCVAVLLFIIGLYFSVTWINWDAAVIFHNPTEADINHGTEEVDDATLLTERWKEKRSYMYDVFTCMILVCTRMYTGTCVVQVYTCTVLHNTIHTYPGTGTHTAGPFL